MKKKMINVLLVEDEMLERANMRESWIWKDDEFNLVADVGNGEDAMDVLRQEKIDIVVTDIKMPFMDGLELSRLIQQEMPHVKIIILSGYSEFSYARRAVSLGVSDYIVKPVKSQDLLEAMKKVAVKLKEEALVSAEVSLFRNQLLDHHDQQRKRFLEDLALGITPVESLKVQASLLNFDLNFKTVCCAIIAYLDDKILINEAEHLMILESQQVVDEILENTGIIAFNRNLRESFLIFRNPNLPDAKSILQQMHTRVRGQCQVSQRMCEPTIALGGVKPGIAGIAESFADARFLLNFQHLVGRGGLLFMDDALPALKSSYGSELTLTNEKALLVNTLSVGSRSDVQSLVEKLVSQMQSLNLSFMFFQFTCIEIMNLIKQFLIDIDEDPNVALFEQNGSKESLSSGSWLNWSNDIPAFKQYLTATLMAVIDIRDKKRKYKYNAVILNAKKYIDQHFADPAINLTSVAASVNVTTSYFSTLFNQEMGESFIEYLTRIRVEKAKVLMKTTSMRTVDIAFAVGYMDSNYFSKIFRRITNESPRNYKNQS